MKELTLAARIENVEAVTDFINAGLEDVGCSMKAQMQIDVAIDEIFSNISRYAYSTGEGEATVLLDTESIPGSVSVSFIDGGTPYNPLSTKEPATDLPVEEREIGGLGIYIVKKTMDEIRYDYKDGKNILTIVKKI